MQRIQLHQLSCNCGPSGPPGQGKVTICALLAVGKSSLLSNPTESPSSVQLPSLPVYRELSCTSRPSVPPGLGKETGCALLTVRESSSLFKPLKRPVSLCAGVGRGAGCALKVGEKGSFSQALLHSHCPYLPHNSLPRNSITKVTASCSLQTPSQD